MLALVLGTKQQRSESKLKNPPGQVVSWCALDLTTQYTIHSMNKEFSLWQYLLWSFQGRDTKLERFLPNNQHTHILSFGLMGNCQK